MAHESLRTTDLDVSIFLLLFEELLFFAHLK